MENDTQIIDVTTVQDTAPAAPMTAQKEHTDLVADYRNYYGLAKTLSTAESIPQTYRGKPADIAIAIDMADRMGVSPMMVMQSMYVVKGKPSWSGQACMTFIRARYKNVKIHYVGDKNTDDRGCYVTAVDNDGDTLEGTTVTIKMARAEGWLTNPKWKNMPEQMLAYRAAAFFARVHCPDLLMGVQAEGEPEDSRPRRREAEDVV